MKTQDIFNKIQEATKEKEAHDFAQKEQVWNKITNKLDQKPQRKIVPLWAKISSVAAVVILGGFLLWNNLANEPANIESTAPSLVTSPENETAPAVEISPSTEAPPVENTSEILDELENNALAVEEHEGVEKKEEISPKPSQKNTVNENKIPSLANEIPTKTNADENLKLVDVEAPELEIAETEELLIEPIESFDEKGIILDGLEENALAYQQLPPPPTSPFFANKITSSKESLVTGKVVDEFGPLELATVTVNETGAFTQTDVNGNFSIKAEIGMHLTITDPNTLAEVTHEITSFNMGEIDLSNGVIEVSDIIVLSYGNAKRSKRRAEREARNSLINQIEAEAATEIGYLSPKEIRRLKKEERKFRRELKKMDPDNEDYSSFVENPFESPETAPLSTFSIDVDKASYSNVRRFINQGQPVPKDAVRIEEMVNYFEYNYAQPTGKDPIAIHHEYGQAPWNPNHKLLKIGLQAKDIPTHELPPSNLVFLLDVSGSMNSQNKLPLLKSSLKVLVDKLTDKDRVSIVVYAGAAGVVLEPTHQKDKILDALNRLEAGGSTAGGEGIELAYKLAQENFIENGNNRVILATDGDFNVGPSSNKDMEALITEKRKSGIFLTCLGFGMGNYKDSKIEILAEKGNGNCAYIDQMQEAYKFLNKEFAGSMYTLAKDVKIQVEFNPKHVQAYRLIGYENRKLRAQDFADDSIDAGELGAGHTVTALYEIIPTGVDSNYFTNTPTLKYSTNESSTSAFLNELATVKFRYKKPNENRSKEVVSIVPNKSLPAEQCSADFKFAAAVAWFGLTLRDSELIPNKKIHEIIPVAKEGLSYDPEGYRAELIRLLEIYHP